MAIHAVDSVTAAVATLRARCELPADPSCRGPVPLDRFFQSANLFDRATNLIHAAVPRLSLAVIVDYLVAERYVSGPHVLADVPRDTDPLDGFLYWAGGEGLAFVNADDILPRRRFTAAHELGHALLHRARMGRFRADTKIREDAEDTDDLEREANRFAAELLMPENVCRAREAEFRREDKDNGVCPRGVLAYRLASELLVSREAMRYRLTSLGVGDDE